MIEIVNIILSDKLMLTGVGSLTLSLFIAIFAGWKWVSIGRKTKKPFVVPNDPPESKFESIVPPPPPPPAPAPEPEPTPPVTPPHQELQSAVSAIASPKEPVDMDKTVVISPGESELQAQVDIVFSQIKNLNKKVYEMESKLDSAPSAAGGGEPANMADINQKLQTLAEHVIALEKEVARLKNPKPPIMPV